MCGIAGALDLNGKREFPVRRLLKMTHAIAHRGPDDEHFHAEPGVILGARRLAIRDVNHGRQPFTNESGQIWAAFNGELYNYPELSQKLLTRGHQLKTKCDTELWPHLYEDHGIAMLEHARGQFAVSLWDRQHRLLILGRDRVGISPLYYSIQDGWLLWASEVKALLASGMVAAKPDVKGLNHLFNFCCAGTSRTYFEGIHMLPPGHFLRVKDGHIDVRQYWDLDFPDAGDERSVADPQSLVNELENLLSNAVARRLDSDVPVVSYISGGLDSTVLLGLTSKHKNGAVPSFTIGMDKGAGPDERTHSAQAAEMLGSKLTTLALSSTKIASSFPDFVTAAEGPVLDTSCAALMQLAEEVNRQGYKVALTGEGADEALAGYSWFKTQKVGGFISKWLSPALPALINTTINRTISKQTKRGINAPRRGVKGVRPAQQFMYEAIGRSRESLYSTSMWEQLADHDSYAELGITNDRIKHWHPLNQSLYVGYKVMLPGHLMHAKGDRIAMRSSVEMRYPFLDEDVIDFCATIDPAYKLRGLTDKWLLRQVAAKTLPVQIANRRKTMFRANLSRIFFEPGRPAWVDQLLSPESLGKTGYFDADAIIQERERLQRMPIITARQRIFEATMTCVITTQLWHHIFFGGGLCDLPVWTPEENTAFEGTIVTLPTKAITKKRASAGR